MLAHYGVQQPTEIFDGERIHQRNTDIPWNLNGVENVWKLLIKAAKWNFVLAVNRAQHKQYAENHVPKH